MQRYVSFASFLIYWRVAGDDAGL